MLKTTEVSKNSNILRKNCKNFKYLEKIAKILSIWKKLQKFQVFGKNCKNFKYLEKIAKISSIWKKLQKSHNFD